MIVRIGYGTKLALMMTLESFYHVCVCLGAVGKTMWNSGAEDILIETGLFKQGTANKCFASAGNYYQKYARTQITTGGNG